MAADQVNPQAGKMDYPAHERNYSGFIRILKMSTVIVAIIAAIVVYIIGY
jgi:Bacterial aa3 type cytochrome c oxidase subunit IV